MDRTDAVFAVSAVDNPAAAYQKMVCLIKEYTRADSDLEHAVAAVIPDSGFVFSCARLQHSFFLKTVSVFT